MKRWQALVLTLICTAAEGAGAADPRLAEANALIGDPETYPQAVALYRELLADAPDGPDATEARTWLARVLSWQGAYDEALAEYAQLTAEEPVPRWAQVEQAEVLSWAGRYDEATAAFWDLVESDPRDARALRGLARVYRWSGRPALADAAYERALALEEDPEALRELRALRASRSWELGGDFEYAGDSDGFAKWKGVSDARIDLGYATRLLVRSSALRVAFDRDGFGPPGIERRPDDVAVDGWVGLEHQLNGWATARVELGGRFWESSPDRFLARAALDLATPAHGVVSFAVDHGDFLERSASVDAVRAGIRDTTLRLASWHPLHEHLALYGYTELTLLSDENERVATGLSFDYTPWLDRDVTLSLIGGYLTYTGPSILYYDPDVDTAGSLALRAAHELVEGLDVGLRGEVGLGYASQDGTDGFGFTWGLGGGPRWQPGGGWWLEAAGRFSRSQRSSRYTSHGATLSVGKAF